MTVYIDIVILENFLINFFLLYLTLQTLKDTIIYKRIILAAFLGAIYTLFVFVPGLNILTSSEKKRVKDNNKKIYNFFSDNFCLLWYLFYVCFSWKSV